MKKVWRNPRYVTVNIAPAEPEDSSRRERLVALLATGTERLLSREGNTDKPEMVDLQHEVSNTCIPTEEPGREVS